jgi:CHAT domain-containing protein/tetratricopeptide (TPR) repeat protein
MSLQRATLEFTLAVYSLRLASDHPRRIEILQALALCTSQESDSPRAVQLWRELVDSLDRSTYGWSSAMEWLAEELEALGRYQEARIHLERLIASGAYPLSRRPSIDWTLGTFLFKLGDFQAAHQVQQSIVDALAQGPETEQLINARANLALTLHNLGRFSEAAPLLERQVSFLEASAPEGHVLLQRARMNLGVTLQELGQVERARQLFEIAEGHLTQQSSAQWGLLMSVRLNLANAMKDMGDLDAARQLLERVLPEIEARTPLTDQLLQGAWFNYCSILNAVQEYEKARVYAERLVNLRSRLLPPYHPFLLQAQHSLATVLSSLSDFHSAHVVEEQVVAIATRSLLPDHPFLQVARTTLAIILIQLDDYPTAHGLLREVLDQYETTLQDNNLLLLGARANMASCLAGMGRSEEANEMLNEVLVRLTNVVGARHPLLLGVRENVAIQFCEAGEFARASVILTEVLEARRRLHPPDHPKLVDTSRNLLRCLIRSGQGVRAIALAHECVSALYRQLQTAVLASSPREAEIAFAECYSAFSLLLSLGRGIEGLPTDSLLVSKTMWLMENGRCVAANYGARLAGKPSSSEAASLIAERMRAGQDLARLARQGADSTVLRAAWTERDRIQRELLRLALGPDSHVQMSSDASAESLISSLKDYECIVSFWRYNRLTGPYENPVSTDSVLAWIGRPLSDPSIIDLADFAVIESACSSWRQALVDLLPTDEIRARGDHLRALVLDPLLPYVETSTHINLVSESVLNTVPIDALPLDEGFVLDRFVVTYRLSSLEVAWPPRAAVTGPDSALVMGDVDFDSSAGPGTNLHTSVVSGATNRTLPGTAPSRFGPLHATRREIDELAAIWVQSGRDPLLFTTLAESDASVANFTRRAVGVKWIHVATHGWFSPDEVPSLQVLDSVDSVLDIGRAVPAKLHVVGCAPMVLCGLAFQGANLVDPDLGFSPGTLTAEEMSALDLSKCGLAVLSACNTNAGIRRIGQGIASFQRALHLAGARSVITSLWRVSDDATAELMAEFYRGLWIAGYSKMEALSRAKRAVRESVDTNGQHLFAMKDWCGWVLTGDP